MEKSPRDYILELKLKEEKTEEDSPPSSPLLRKRKRSSFHFLERRMAMADIRVIKRPKVY